MPWQPLRRCTEPGCNKRVKSGKCEEHRRAAWRAEDARRGHRRARGYYLDEIAVRQWKEKSRQLSGREDLTPADWSNLELYCVNYSIYRKAVEDLATRGFSIVNSQGSESRNPALSAKADAERIMIKMASLLGFDPVSRRRNPPETEEEDELDRLA
jgi:P27 family predicted phage terminase small subunit